MNRSKLRNHHATSLTILKDTKRRKQNGLNPAQRYFPESRPIGIQCDLGSIHILNILFVENTVIGKFILFHVITSHIALPFPKTDTKCSVEISSLQLVQALPRLRSPDMS
ncbi:uncharacterized protein LOC110835033 isoform X6 [Zootermopsis nevadensis]|uniref:uncharacterized protein LOC110835033 isoform X6 n=1 Tax=Zootermopsis nevadensis TaxID=136037 RepID=UPI000B8EA694|nr:uncharacterized protein LOC110835033 isoform X6 [Zootermopsis nevadensis]